MENNSKPSKDLLAAVENVLNAMAEEATSDAAKDQALLNELSNKTSNAPLDASTPSGSEGQDALPEEMSSEDSRPDTWQDSVLEWARKEYPGHTDEELKEMALHLL